MEIPLESGHTVRLDDADAQVVEGMVLFVGRWGDVLVADRQANTIAALHILLIPAVPPGMLRDHINRDRTDNRRSNLRVVTPSQNQMNRRIGRNNKTGHRGVHFRKDRPSKPWMARITVNRTVIGLGHYETMDEAVVARRAAEDLYFGEFNAHV